MRQEVVVVSVEDILKTAMPATGTSHQLTAIRLGGEWMVRKGAGRLVAGGCISPVSQIRLIRLGRGGHVSRLEVPI